EREAGTKGVFDIVAVVARALNELGEIGEAADQTKAQQRGLRTHVFHDVCGVAVTVEISTAVDGQGAALALEEVKPHHARIDARGQIGARASALDVDPNDDEISGTTGKTDAQARVDEG